MAPVNTQGLGTEPGVALRLLSLSAHVYSLRYTGLVLRTTGSTERKTDTLHFQVTP